MKKLYILIIFVGLATSALAQVKNSKATNTMTPSMEVLLNQQMETLNALIDSMAIAHQRAIDKISGETKSACSTYYDRLDNEMDRTFSKFSWIIGIIGAIIGVIVPIIINRVYERSFKSDINDLKDIVNQRLKDQDRITASRLRELYKDIEKQTKEQNKTFGKRFAEHKAYIDRISSEIENYEKSTKVYQLISEAQAILETNTQNAIELYSQVLALDKKNEVALLWRGIAYSLLNKGEASLADLNAALAINPRLARAYNNIGNVYAANQKYDLAEENYNKALEINPQYDVVYRNIALMYLKQDQHFDKIEQNLNKAIFYNNEYIEAYITRSQMYRRMSEIEKNKDLKGKYKELSLADIKQANRLKRNNESE